MIRCDQWNTPQIGRLKKGFNILSVEHGIASNVETLIHDPVYFVPGEIYSQVTNWEKIEGIEYGLEMDSYCFIHDTPELGFTAIEVSDGTMEMSLDIRQDCMKRALDGGFKVITEVGKKSPDEKIALQETHKMIEHDLELGALLVIIEAREGGKGVGIFDKAGAVDETEVDEIIAGVGDLDKLMWEAPIKNQQQYMILRFGNNVNLGNIPTTDILALEALRQGLRGDTLKRALERG